MYGAVRGGATVPHHCLWAPCIDCDGTGSPGQQKESAQIKIRIHKYEDPTHSILWGPYHGVWGILRRPTNHPQATSVSGLMAFAYLLNGVDAFLGDGWTAYCFYRKGGGCILHHPLRRLTCMPYFQTATHSNDRLHEGKRATNAVGPAPSSTLQVLTCHKAMSSLSSATPEARMRRKTWPATGLGSNLGTCSCISLHTWALKRPHIIALGPMYMLHGYMDFSHFCGDSVVRRRAQG